MGNKYKLLRVTLQYYLVPMVLAGSSVLTALMFMSMRAGQGSRGLFFLCLFLTSFAGVLTFIQARQNLAQYKKLTESRTRIVEGEEKLKAVNKYLEDMLNHIPDPIFMKNRKHEWIGGNTAFWEFMAGPPEKFLGKSDYEFFPKEEADAFWEKDDMVFKSGTTSSNEEFFTDHEGNRRILFTKKIPFVDDNDEQYLVGIIHDITERKAAEEVKEKLIERLTESNIELERFAHITSHDLKEPLRMIKNFGSRLEERLSEGVQDERTQKYLKFIIDGAERAQKLVSDLLAYSSLDRLATKYESINTAELVEIILKENLAALIEDNGAMVSYEGLPVISGNKTQVMQVFQNLISNAIIYHSYSHKPKVRISASKRGSSWHFLVEDNGIGIEQKHMDKVFDIFKRLHKRTEYQGTGVGLAICKKVVERHGGNIWAESEPGQGSKFFFSIPIIEQKG